MECQTAGCKNKVVFDIELESGNVIHACTLHQRELFKLVELGVIA